MTEHHGATDAPTLGQSVIVELVFGVVGIVAIVATGHTFDTAFAVPQPPALAIGLGIAVGGLLGWVFGSAVTREPFADRVRPFLSRFTSARPTVLNFAILAAAAALGEETLFRAAIQPVGGILVASILFMLAHSVIADFRHPTPGKLAYAALAFGMGILLGVLYAQVGLVASMSAHFAFDAVALTLARPLLPLRLGSAPMKA